MRIDIFQDSQLGGRASNQDRVAYAHHQDALLLVVADGMGGHARGEVAAEIAVGLLLERFKRIEQTQIDAAQFLREGFAAAHLAIADYTHSHGLPEYPRTTCVACIVQGAWANWAHVGDSRLYMFRQGRLLKRTKDHSRVQRLLDAGLIREDQALVHPDRNRIYSCLGGEHEPTVSLSPPTALRPGDVLMLSSDGFWGVLTIAEIEAAIADEPVSIALPKLLARARENGGERADNLSVVGIAWEAGQQTDLAYVESAVTMPLSLVNQSTQAGWDGAELGSDLSDAEIERTIAEIQAAIQKYSRSS